MSELSGIRTEYDLLNRLVEVERAVASLQRQNLRVGTVSEMSADLGEFWGGDIFALESGVYPDDPTATGVFLSMNGYMIDGVNYKFGAVKNGVIVLGVTTEGQTVTGSGSGSIDQGVVLNGVLTILSQLATYAGYTRQMRLRMNLPNEDDIPGGNAIPAASWEYQEPAENELVTNGSFNTNVANWKGLLSKASGYSGKYGEALGALVTGTITSNSKIYAIAIHPITGDIYVGGTFTTIDGVSANYIARFDIEDSTWNALGAQVNNEVYALAFDSSGNLYAGGAFHTAGGTTVNHIAKWNGSAWSALGSTGVNAEVWAICVSGSDVYAGGDFTTAAGTTVNYIAKWNGSAWSALGSTGVNARVECLVMVGTDLYVGGQFTTAAGTTVNYIAMWNGSWNTLDDGTVGVADWVNCLATDGTNLFVGGWFEDAGSETDVYGVARWDGTAWHKLGSSFPGFTQNQTSVKAIAITSNGDAYMYCTSPEGYPAAPSCAIYKYDAGNDTLTEYADVTLSSTTGLHEGACVDANDTVFLGGSFTAIDGITAKLIVAKTNTIYSDTFSLTAGDNSPYEFSGYLLNSLGKQVTLTIKWYTSGDVYISEDVIYSGSTALGWTNYTLTPTPPPTAGKGQIYLTISGDFMISQVGLDSVSFTESAADTYGIMLHPYPLAIIDSAIERIMSASAFRLFSPRAPVISLVATATGDCTNGAHKVKVVFRDAYGSSLASAESNSVTVDATHKQITVPLELGPWGTSARDVYMTKAGGSTFYLAKSVDDNTTTTTNVSVADDDLVTEEPAANTSGSRALHRHFFSVDGHEMKTSATLTRPTSQLDLAYTTAAAANNGDEFYFDFDCAGGTYTLVYILWHSTYFGKVDIYLDNELIESGYDLYASSGAVDIHEDTGVTITGDGVHTLMFKVNGKNGSSSDYSFGAVMISGFRTGD